MVASWVCEVTVILTQKSLKFRDSLCEDFNDLTSPTSNIINLTISGVYDI